MNIHCKIKLAPGAKLPTRAHDTDTGYDVYAHRITIVEEGGKETEVTPDKPELDNYIFNWFNLHTAEAETGKEKILQSKITHIIIDTGVSIAPPAGYACIAAAQSRVAKSGWMIANGIGVIDNGYRGTIKFVYSFQNNDNMTDLSLFAIGKKCGQLIFHKVETATFEQVSELPDTDRGTGGFGSTGNN